ncbi:MAG: crossover junction endodeoxyribonuclease RuvC, partial [Bacteroidales bacterium]|nr:crossover junction endodeoxyribonuclease RuvC [Bacteroidales bacterium]
MQVAAGVEKVILGIDPGTNVMGYGLLRVTDRKPELMVMGVLQLKKLESHYLRLKRIYERVLGLIEQYHPDELAIESPFVGINPSSMIK